jgi:hypothetical protein
MELDTAAEAGPVSQRILQLAMAFGQGAGTMPASRASLATLFGTYSANVRADTGWDGHALLALEFGRALGRAAAAHALRAGRCVIDIPDVEFALKVVRNSQIEPLGECPLTERRPRG